MNGVLNNWTYIWREILIHYNLLSIPTNFKFGFYTYKYSTKNILLRINYEINCICCHSKIYDSKSNNNTK